MTRIITDFEILRNVKASCAEVAGSLSRKPKCVCTIIDEETLLRTKALVHNETVFYEDRFHDWNITDKGEFRYYSRVAEYGDVLVVYEYKEQR